MQKTLDRLLPRWLYMIILLMVVFYANYFSNMSVIYDTFSSMGMFGFENIKAMIYIVCVIVAVAQLGIYELIARVYYKFVLRSTNLKGLTCTQMQFVDTLRVFYIFKCVALGSATLIVYFVPYFIPLAVHIFDLFFSIVFYYLFYLYIKNKYINKELSGRTFLYLAVPFLIYSALALMINLLL